MPAGERVHFRYCQQCTEQHRTADSFVCGIGRVLADRDPDGVKRAEATFWSAGTRVRSCRRAKAAFPAPSYRARWQSLAFLATGLTAVGTGGYWAGWVHQGSTAAPAAGHGGHPGGAALRDVGRAALVYTAHTDTALATPSTIDLDELARPAAPGAPDLLAEAAARTQSAGPPASRPRRKPRSPRTGSRPHLPKARGTRGDGGGSRHRTAGLAALADRVRAAWWTLSDRDRIAARCLLLSGLPFAAALRAGHLGLAQADFALSVLSSTAGVVFLCRGAVSRPQSAAPASEIERQATRDFLAHHTAADPPCDSHGDRQAA
ncbi:hypothetical protein [Streptomyces sp. NPDC029003]|uniref:hypothetical protein n=1 Tax=Streptomyces sp. NPDC029003 TaxID=3155125 RepID=UPI003411A918